MADAATRRAPLSRRCELYTHGRAAASRNAQMPDALREMINHPYRHTAHGSLRKYIYLRNKQLDLHGRALIDALEAY